VLAVVLLAGGTRTGTPDHPAAQRSGAGTTRVESTGRRISFGEVHAYRWRRKRAQSQVRLPAGEQRRRASTSSTSWRESQRAIRCPLPHTSRRPASSSTAGPRPSPADIAGQDLASVINTRFDPHARRHPPGDALHFHSPRITMESLAPCPCCGVAFSSASRRLSGGTGSSRSEPRRHVRRRRSTRSPSSRSPAPDVAWRCRSRSMPRWQRRLRSRADLPPSR
jgi:hypothetical protein